MPGLSVQVTLSEALEVRAGPLVEPEIWGILCQAAETLQDIFFAGDYVSEEGLGFAISPDTIMLCSSGRIAFAESTFSTISNKNIVPPEFSPYIRPSDATLEKWLVFALGMSLYESADFRLPLHQELTLSERLDSLLCAMCEENPLLRSSLGQILDDCTSYMRHESHVMPHSHHVTKLYKLVLGSNHSLHTDVSAFDGRLSRPRSRRSLSRQRSVSHSRSRSRSKSNSRSRSRSRSRTREGRTSRSKRPHPVGRDQPTSFTGAHKSERGRSFSSHHFGRSRKSDFYGTKYSSNDSLSSRLYEPHSTKSKLGHGIGHAIHDFSFDGNIYPSGGVRHSSLPTQNQTSLHTTYNRVIERRRKLQALRYGLEIEDQSDTASGYSEAATDITDRKSVLSASSHTHGVYKPHALPRYGSLGTLNVRGSNGSRLDVSSINFIDSKQEDYIRQQELELESLRRVSKKMSGNQGRRSVSAEAFKGRTDSSLTRPREFTGPEFVVMSNKPKISLTVPNAHLINASHRRNVNVVHLTGQRMQITCGPNTTGRQLYDTVLAHLGLREHYFFGLAYIREGEHWFLEDDQKMHKVAPPGWKDSGRQTNILSGSFNLFVRIKYYVDDVRTIRHAESRHLYYLQLRHDVLEEGCHVTDDEALPLAGVALQAEYGDYDPRLHPRAYFQPDHYISQRNIRHIGSATVRDDIPSHHSSNSGLDLEEAEWKFMRLLQQCPEYGIHFYKIFRSKKATAVPLWAGIGVHGVLIAEQRGDFREPQHRHPWHFTQKISFNRRRFSITPKSEAGPLKLAKMNYYTDSHRKGRYLVQFCTAQHHFHMRMRIVNINDMFDQEYPMEAGTGKSGRFEFSDYDAHAYGSFDEASVEEHQEEEPGYENIQRQRERKVVHSSRSRHETFSDVNDNAQDMTGLSDQLGKSSRSQDDTICSYTEENIKRTMAQRSVGASVDSPERIIQIVELEKEGEDGLGITIVGGENTGKLDLGIFVQSVNPGGPAARDGRIQPGDRIIAISGHSLEGMPHHVAVDLIRDSFSSVQLVISRNKSEMQTRQECDSGDDSASSEGNGNFELTDSNELRGNYLGRKTRSPTQTSDGPRLGDRQDDMTDYHNHDINRGQQSGYDDRSSADSSDLELENILPPEALRSGYVKQNTSYSPAQLHGTRVVGNNLRAIIDDVGNENEVSPTREGSDGYVSDVELDEVLRSVDQQSKSLSPQYRAQTHSLEPGDRYETVLKKIGASLGLNVTGGVNTSVKDGGIYVKSLNDNGPALQDGMIHVGDRVLAVNEASLVGITHRQAVEILRSAPPVCKLIMERGIPPISQREYPVNPDSPASNINAEFRSHDQIGLDITKRAMAYYPALSTGSLLNVHLHHNASIGPVITVFGGNDFHPEPTYCFPRVKQIIPVARTALLDQIVAGDVILEVNEEPAKGLSHQELVALFESSTTDLDLLLLRPPDGLLPPAELLVDETIWSLRGTPASQMTSSSTVQGPRERGGLPDGASPTMTNIPSPISTEPNSKTPSRSFSLEPDFESNVEKSDGEDSDIGDSASVVHTHQENQQTITNTRGHQLQTNSPCGEHGFHASSSKGLGQNDQTDARYLLGLQTEHAFGESESATVSTEVKFTREDISESGDEEDKPRHGHHQYNSDKGPSLKMNSSLQAGEFEVSMEKGTKGLGFTVAGGQNTTGYFYVKDILFDPALSDGRIQKGDRLIKVNDQDMTNLNHREAVDYLRMTPNQVTIRFFRPVRVVTPTGNHERRVVEKNNSSEPETPSDQSVMYSKKSINITGLIKYQTHNKEYFTMSKMEDLGDSDDYNSEEEELEELEERHRNGMLTPTHSIDPTPTLQFEKPTAGGYTLNNHLANPAHESDDDNEDGQKSHNSSWGNLTLPIPEEKSCEEVEQITAGAMAFSADESSVVRVDLDRPESENYGFSLVQGEVGTNTGLYIRSITPASVAAEDDRLRVGDRLLQVNRTSVIGMPHNKAVALIKNSSDKLNLTVSRSRATPTPSLIPRNKNTSGDGQNDHQRYHSDRESPWSQTSSNDQLDNHDENDGSDENTEGFQSMNSSVNYTPSNLPTNSGEGPSGDEKADLEKQKPVISKTRPEKPPRCRGIPQLPSEISDGWMDAQPLLKLPLETVHYSGRELQATLLNFQKKIEVSDPVEEYKTLRHAKLTDNCNDARKPENKTKNRYRNVLPYDSTRVRLSGLDDYINASHVYYTVGRDMLRYIACQGPLPNTTDDFWRMVWEVKSDTIAMVTLDVEGGKVKCHRYWPDSKDSPITVCDQYEVSLLDAHTLQNFDVHHIQMKDIESGCTQSVFHVNFTTWPDHGTPDTGIPLLQYLRFLHLVHNSGPIIVHCSAGIGRTGALITVDIGLAQIERDIKLNIHKIVLDLRRQRQGMIQTKGQYVFCYKAAYEALLSIDSKKR